MRKVLDQIAEKKEAFRRAPFLTFLRDRALSPAERLVFVPVAAPFVMAFADLNNLVLHRPEANDPLESLLNVHSREDGSHFRLYLDDLVTLGFDLQLRYTEAIRRLWAAERPAVRRTCHVLTALLATATPRLRVLVVLAIEATGSVAFAAFREVADELQATTGLKLRYFGRRHEALETGHLMGAPDVESALRSIVFTEEESAAGRRMVDIVFASFDEMLAEMLAYSQVATKRT